MSKAISMSFSVQPEMYQQIDSFCADRGCTRSWFISTAVKNYLAECMEDMADYEAAVSAWKKFSEGNRKTFTSDELRKEFGI